MKKQWIKLMVIQFLVLFSCRLSAEQKSLAIILYSQGQLQVIRSTGEKIDLISQNLQLYENDVVIIQINSSVTLYFESGEMKKFYGYKKIIISPALTDQNAMTAEINLFDQIYEKLENSSKVVKERTGAIRSGYYDFSLISPKNCYVQYNAINFSWIQFPDFDHYRFQLFENSEPDSPIFSKVVKDTTLLLFPDSLDLQRGESYYWKVNPIGSSQETWDSSYFQFYSYEQEKYFIDGKNKILNYYQEYFEIPLVVYYEMQKAYHAEYEYLLTLVKKYKSDKLYYGMMADLLSKTGVPKLVHLYATKAASLETK